MSLLSTQSADYDIKITTSNALLLEMLKKEFRNGIDNRYRDILAMQHLFSKCLPHMKGLHQELSNLSERKISDFKFDVLNELHDECTRLLISVHERVENMLAEDNADVSDLNASIWEYYQQHFMRHKLT